MKIFYIVFLFTLYSCFGRNDQQFIELSKIEISTIEIVEIKKNLYDTIAVRLTSEEIQKFVNTVNKSKSSEMRKAIPKYWVFLKNSQDSILIYKILDSYIGKNDRYIKTNDAMYFHNIYKKGKKTTSTISI